MIRIFIFIRRALLALALLAGGCSGCGRAVMVGDASAADADTLDTALDEGTDEADVDDRDTPFEQPDGPVPSVAWALRIDGGMNFEVTSVLETGERRYVTAGIIWTDEHQGFDLWLGQIENESLTWQRTLGGTGDDEASSIARCRDGGLVAAGSSHSFHGNDRCAWVLKTDEHGAILWQKAMLDEEAGWARSVLEDGEGNLLVFGGMTPLEGGSYHHSRAWMIKLDGSGELLQQKSIGGDNSDELLDAVELSDGSIVALGSTRSFGSGNTDAWVIKMDRELDVTWQKTLGGEGRDRPSAIAARGGGGVLVSWTSSQAYVSTTNMHVAGLDADGGVLFHRTVGGSSSNSAGALAATRDGGFVLAGTTGMTGDDFESMCVASFDAEAYLRWQLGLGRGLFTVAFVNESADGSITLLGNHFLGDLVGYIGALLIKLEMDEDAPGSCSLPVTTLMEVRGGGSAVQDSNAAVEETDGEAFEPVSSEASPTVEVTRICPE